MIIIDAGKTLRRLRKDRNLSLSDIARASGVHLATLSRIENNKSSGSLSNYFGMAKALGLKLSELFQEFEKDNVSP